MRRMGCRRVPWGIRGGGLSQFQRQKGGSKNSDPLRRARNGSTSPRGGRRDGGEKGGDTDGGATSPSRTNLRAEIDFGALAPPLPAERSGDCARPPTPDPPPVIRARALLFLSVNIYRTVHTPTPTPPTPIFVVSSVCRPFSSPTPPPPSLCGRAEAAEENIG